ncbi:S41 family peptidase [Thermodesulfobacteriota bacterium]
MGLKRMWMVPLIGVTVFILHIFVIQSSLADEKADFKPLFPVKLDHGFPDPKETFEEVKGLILNNYYCNEISEEALYWAAIQGMLRHISPPEHPGLAKIWTAEEYEKVLQALRGVQVSIGIKSSFNPREGSLTITEVLPNSPASPILKPFDRILRIDSQQLKNRPLEEVNKLLKGGESTEVTLTVNRDVEVFDVIVKRRKFETQNLIVSPLTDKIFMVEIKKFTIDLSKKLRVELEKFMEEGFKELIIDLRNNTGGIFAESLRVAELFLPEKDIILRTLQRETGLQNYISVNKEPFKFDIAVLVNPNTASSGEILVSSLQDHQRAVIIGTRTYGKGVFDKTFTLKNDFRVRFVTGAMYSPKGKSWQSKGIAPDFLVEQDDNTLTALLKLGPRQRFRKDVAMITAYKLLTRY